MSQAGATLDFLVEAQALNGQRLRNYDNDTANYANTALLESVARNTPADQPSDNFATRWQATLPDVWNAGQLLASVTDGSLSKRSDMQPDGPFAQVEVGLQVTSEMDARDFAPGAKTLVTLSGDAAPLTGSLELRYGRLVLDNSYGPETENLPVSLRAEYWNGDLFTTHGLDQCTGYAPAELAIVSYIDPITTTADGAAAAPC